MTFAAVGVPHRCADRRVSVVWEMAGRGDARPLAVFVRGEIDASNAGDFADALCDVVAGNRRVRLDLSELEFMAIDGVSALHAINAHMARAGASWCVVAGGAVSRVLVLCDPEELIPVDAPRRGARPGRPTLHLVQTR